MQHVDYSVKLPAPLCSLCCVLEMCIIRIIGLFKDGLSAPLNLLPRLSLLSVPLSKEERCSTHPFNRVCSAIIIIIFKTTAFRKQCCIFRKTSSYRLAVTLAHFCCQSARSFTSDLCRWQMINLELNCFKETKEIVIKKYCFPNIFFCLNLKHKDILPSSYTVQQLSSSKLKCLAMLSPR